MFTDRDLIDHTYFKVIRCPEGDNFIEIQSRNTRDSWVIQKGNPSLTKYPVILFHKHPGQKFYHKHWQCYNVVQAIRSIYRHDDYEKLRKWHEKIEHRRRRLL